jgi:hypothetical protein
MLASSGLLQPRIILDPPEEEEGVYVGGCEEVVVDAGLDAGLDEPDGGTEWVGATAFGEALVGRGLHFLAESRFIAMSAWTWPRPLARWPCSRARALTGSASNEA